MLSELSSDAALPRIKDEKPDCVLIDIMMPGKDGLELCQEIKSAKNISMPKVIIVSAKTFEFDKKRAFNLGADGFINKPIDAENFAERINSIIEDTMELARAQCRPPGSYTLCLIRSAWSVWAHSRYCVDDCGELCLFRYDLISLRRRAIF